MAYSLDETQEDILEYIRDEMAETVHEMSIPEPETVLRDARGNVKPYIAVQFGDLQDGYSETFAGAVSNDFVLPIYFQTVTSDPALSRRIANKLILKMLGYQSRYGGQVRKRLGGAMFPINNMDGTTAAYINPSSFGVKIQLFDDV